MDIVIHVETRRGRPNTIAQALKNLDYEIQPAHSRRKPAAHRFRRGPDTIDVMVADHAAPRVRELMSGYDMIPIEGGTQALRRTINARLHLESQNTATVSVPDPFGALILKSAAHLADSRDAERHLLDAAVLLACIDDPFAALESHESGSDRKRLLHLNKHLSDVRHPAWVQLDPKVQSDAQAVLDILVRGS